MYICYHITIENLLPHIKVGIVLTDGKSNEPSQTVMEAMKAHDAGITMMAIGVGDNLDMNELEAIASEPLCLHLFILDDFTEVDDLKYVIEKRTCEGSVKEYLLIQ